MLLVSISEVSVSEPIPWYRYRYRLHPVSVPIPVNFTVVILQVISLFIKLTVQYVIIIITFLSVNIVKDKNRVVLCSCQYVKNTKPVSSYHHHHFSSYRSPLLPSVLRFIPLLRLTFSPP